VVEEALIEMYLAGVSVRRVEDITEALWGTRVSPSTVSDLNKKIYATIEAWRNRPIEGEHPYVYLDGIVLNLAAARLRHIAGTAWSTKRYLNIELLKDQEMRDTITA
jgi:putative transposase